MSEYEKPADGYAIVTNYGAFVGIWRDEESAKTVHKARTPSAPEERVVPVYFAARQPSPSARDVALKCAEMIEDHWNDSLTMVNQKEQALRSGKILRVYADTLGNESAAAQPGNKQLAGHTGETSQPASAAEPPRRCAPSSITCHAPGDRCGGCDHYLGLAARCKYAPAEPTPSQIDADLAKHKARYGSEDPAPEAGELTREQIETYAKKVFDGQGMLPAGPDQFDALCDMAIRSLDLQQALARAQHESQFHLTWLSAVAQELFGDARPVGWEADCARETRRLMRIPAELARAQERISEMELEFNWSRWLQDCARKTGVTVRYEGDTLCVVHGDFEKDLERVEAELAKVRDELRKAAESGKGQ